MILFHLIKKELRQMVRNRVLPLLFVLVPAGLANMIPRLATQEVKGLRFAVVDNDHSTLSRRLVHKLDASVYIDLAYVASSYRDAMAQVNAGAVDAVVEIPDGYEKGFVVGDGTPIVQVSANSVNGTKGTMASMYVTQVVSDYADETLPPTIGRTGPPALRFLFNPRLDYKVFMIPAVFAMLMILFVGFLPALNIVSEKEKGTSEQVNVSPISRFDFTLSKIVPYVIIGVLMVLEAMVVAHGLYGITCAGSVPLLVAATLLFSMLIASLGLVISNYASTLQQAALTMWFFLMVFLLMSGMLTPIASMPEWAQWLTVVNPMRYFIDIMRSIYIKGATASQLMPQFLAIALMTAGGWAWAILSYRKSS